MPDDAQDFSFTAGGGLSPAELLARRRPRPGARQHAHVQRRARSGRGYSIAETRAGRLGPRERHLRRRQPGVEHRRVRRARRSPARSRTTSAARSWSSRTRTPDDPQDFSFTAGGGLSPTSFSARRRRRRDAVEHAHVHRRAGRRAATRSSETVPGGWDQTSATCGDGSPVSNIDVAPGETVTCTFANRKRGQHRGREGRPAQRPAGLLLHGRRRAVARELLARRRLRRHALQHAHVHERRAGERATRVVRDACPAAGTRRAPPATTAARCRTSTCRAGETVTCTFTNDKRGPDRGREGRGPQRRAGLRLHGRRRALARRASRSTTTPTGRCRTRARSTTSRRAAGYSVSETVPSGWDQASATCDDGSPVANITVSVGRDRHLHVHEPASAGQIVVVKDAVPDDPQDFAFTAGGGLSPGELPPRRRRRRDALEHPHVHRRAARRRATRSPRRSRAGWDQTGATCDDGSPVVEHRRGPRRDRHLHVPEPQARADLDHEGRDARRRRRTSRSRPAAGFRPASFSLDDDLDPTLSNTRVFDERAGRLRLLGLRDRARRLGPDERDLRRRQPGCRTSACPPARRHVHVHEPKRGPIVVVKDASPTTRRTSRSPPAAACRPSSFSLDDDSDGTLSNTRTFANVAPGSGYSLSETRAGRLGPDRRDL